MFDLVVQKIICPGFGGRARPVSPIVPPHASNRRGPYFVEEGQAVQSVGRNFT
jgi:hypothetical protein